MMISQFGINMLVPIFLCTFSGIFLDRLLGTSFLAVTLFFAGALAGFTNVFRFAKKIYETPPQTRRRSARTENGAGAGNAPTAGETDAKKEAE